MALQATHAHQHTVRAGSSLSVRGGRWVHFLLAPGEVAAYDWPLGVQHFGGRTRTVTFVGIPALEGNTWPLRWYSAPTVTAPYVSATKLRAALTPGTA